MRISTLKIMLVCAAALSMASGAVFAQGGGNGQGGSGGGDAHSAATAGMTHWGDPVPGSMDMMPGSGMKKKESTNGDMQSMAPSDSMTAAKTGQ